MRNFLSKMLLVKSVPGHHGPSAAPKSTEVLVTHAEREMIMIEIEGPDRTLMNLFVKLCHKHQGIAKTKFNQL